MAVEFEVGPCKKKAALSAIPLKNTELSLDSIAEAFPSLATSRHVIVVELADKEKHVEIIVHKDGKLIFKQCDDKKLATRLAKRIYKVGAR